MVLRQSLSLQREYGFGCVFCNWHSIQKSRAACKYLHSSPVWGHNIFTHAYLWSISHTLSELWTPLHGLSNSCNWSHSMLKTFCWFILSFVDFRSSPHTLQKEFPEMPMQEGQSQNVHILQTICHCTVFVNTDITFLCFFVSQSLQCVSTSSPYCHLFLLWFKPLSEWSRGLQCLVVTIVVIWRWINKLKLKSVLMTHRSLSLPQRL